MADTTLHLSGNFYGKWRVKLALRLLRLAAWLLEGFGCRVSLNGKPWREWHPNFEVTVKPEGPVFTPIPSRKRMLPF